MARFIQAVVNSVPVHADIHVEIGPNASGILSNEPLAANRTSNTAAATQPETATNTGSDEATSARLAAATVNAVASDLAALLSESTNSNNNSAASTTATATDSSQTSEGGNGNDGGSKFF